MTSTIYQMALHAIDSGTHTCSVVDAVGNVGMATTEINVLGKQKHVRPKFDHIIPEAVVL